MHIVPSKYTASLKEAALELIWPTRCAGCEQTGKLLCDDCLDKLPAIAQEHACKKCGAPYGYLVCTECYSREGKHEFSFSEAVAALEMNELSGRIVVLYKDNNEHRLALFLAECLAAYIPPSWVQWAECLTWIPADKQAKRKRGFDHMQRVALELTELIPLTAKRLLTKAPARDQRSLNRKSRSENLQRCFKIANSSNHLPTRLLLIDDVFTTGATLDAATTTLKEAGVHEVRVASFTRVW